jgi:hypothetical protein
MLRHYSRTSAPHGRMRSRRELRVRVRQLTAGVHPAGSSSASTRPTRAALRAAPGHRSRASAPHGRRLAADRARWFRVGLAPCSKDWCGSAGPPCSPFPRTHRMSRSNTHTRCDGGVKLNRCLARLSHKDSQKHHARVRARARARLRLGPAVPGPLAPGRRGRTLSRRGRRSRGPAGGGLCRCAVGPSESEGERPRRPGARDSARVAVTAGSGWAALLRGRGCHGAVTARSEARAGGGNPRRRRRRRRGQSVLGGARWGSGGEDPARWMVCCRACVVTRAAGRRAAAVAAVATASHRCCCCCGCH